MQFARLLVADYINMNNKFENECPCNHCYYRETIKFITGKDKKEKDCLEPCNRWRAYATSKANI